MGRRYNPAYTLAWMIMNRMFCLPSTAVKMRPKTNELVCNIMRLVSALLFANRHAYCVSRVGKDDIKIIHPTWIDKNMPLSNPDPVLGYNKEDGEPRTLLNRMRGVPEAAYIVELFEGDCAKPVFSVRPQ